MKHTRIILALLCLIMAGGGKIHAQNATVTWEEVQEEDKKTMKPVLIGQDKSGTYFLHSKKIEREWVQFLEKYDEDGNLASSEEVAIKVKEGYGKLKDLKFLLKKGQLILFSTYGDKKKDLVTVFASVYDLEGKQKVSEKEIAKYSEKRPMDAIFGTYHFSEDDSKLMVYFADGPQNGEKQAYRVRIFDLNLETIWEKKAMVPSNEYSAVIRSLVTNEGKPIMLVRYQKDKKDTRGDKPNFKYLLYAFENNKSGNEGFEISIGDYFINSINMTVDKKDKNLLFAGFYSKKETGYYGGSYCLKVDGKSMQVLKKDLKDFPTEFLSHYMREKSAEKGNELYEYHDKGLITLKDGSSFLIAERRTTHVVPSADGKSNRIYIHHNAILAIRIDETGEIGDYYRLPKNQFYQAVSLVSFVAFPYENKICFLYNTDKDDPKTGGFEGAPDKDYGKDQILMLTTIDEDGKITRKKLLDYEDKLKHRVMFNSSQFFRLSDKEYYIQRNGLVKDTYSFGRLRLD